MNLVEAGSLDDAVERLSSCILEQPDKRIAWILGAGMSSPIIPSTADLCAMFAAALGENVDSPNEDWPSYYKALATRAKLRKGPSAVAKIIRMAVTTAMPTWDGTGDPGIDNADWLLPPQQSALADIIKALPEQQRGPIITTNFDPLTEVALSRAGLAAASISSSGLSPIGFSARVNEIPVVHIHGFWRDSYPLNTTAELGLSREALESQLSTVLDNSIVVVAGYGGWDDAFSRALTNFMTSSAMELSGSELIWLHHGAPGQAGAIKAIRGLPPVSEYTEVNFATLSAHVLKRLITAARPSVPSAPGVNTIPRSEEIMPATEAQLDAFAAGCQPDLSSAAAAPLIGSTIDFIAAIEGPPATDSVTVALGPTGEGKSLGLLQAARRAADTAGVRTVSLFLAAGAPIPAIDLFRELRRRFDHTFIFADEGDLILDQLVDNSRASDGAPGRIHVAIAMHSQYANKVSWKKSTGAEVWTSVDYTGLRSGDSHAIAAFWLNNGLLPAAYQGAVVGDIAAMIEEGARGFEGRSLFGAMLHLWSSEELASRVHDLLIRLDRMKLGDVSFRRIFEAIALVHCAWLDDNGGRSPGLPMAAIAEWCGLYSSDVMRLVVRPLGREAALAKVGSDIYVRHPAIARAVVGGLAEEDRMILIRMLGNIGGRMRLDPERPDGLKTLTHLGLRLTGAAAIAAATASMSASGLLEARVTMMKVMRQQGISGTAHKLALRLQSQIGDFADSRESARGFFVEWAVNESVLGDHETAAYLAIYSLSDAVPGWISEKQLEYGIVNAVNFARRIDPRRGFRSALVSSTTALADFVKGNSSRRTDAREQAASAHHLVAALRSSSLPLLTSRPSVEWRYSELLRAVTKVKRAN